MFTILLAIGIIALATLLIGLAFMFVVYIVAFIYGSALFLWIRLIQPLLSYIQEVLNAKS